MRYNDNFLNDNFKRGGSSNSKMAVYQHPELAMQQLTDKEGLDNAYAQADKLYVHGDTMWQAPPIYKMLGMI